MHRPEPRVPVDASINLMHGYITQEAPEIQFEIIANLLLWFFVEHASDDEADKGLASIARSIPKARAAALFNMQTVGGMQ